uniref:Putative phospholipase a2 inhibitor n=1 Tax=Ixodes scapularis TaxID=6945 RepID=A0A4D5RHZ0_IXOSC
MLPREFSYFGNLFFLTLPVHLVYAIPSCFSSGGVRYPSYTCSGFKNSANFNEFVDRASVRSNVRFILTNSQLDSIPPRAFTGIRASALELENVRVNNSLTFDADEDSFLGLEASLEKIVFSRNSSVPRAWTFSKRMEKLRQVVLFEINRLSLSSSFNDLPKSVVQVDVVGSTIQDVDDHWLSSLPNLEAIVIRNSNVSSFMRTMLPNPATKLEALLLENCSLTQLPVGFSDSLPSLKYVSLVDNLITTLDAGSFWPLRGADVIVRITGNPLHCDCRMRAVLHHGRTSLHGQCRSPEWLRDRDLRTLQPEDLQCSSSGVVN